MRVTHLSLSVSDLSRSEKFYRDVLGLPVQREGGMAAVRWPEFLLVLAQAPASTRTAFHFGFQVDKAADVDAWAQRLRAGRVRILAEPATHDGTHHLFFLDPDNYQIEIYSEEPRL